MSKIKIIAITGRSGSGKSSLAEYYAGKGYSVADGDEIARKVVLQGTPTLAKLVGHFGGDILDINGQLNRRALAEKAFASPQETTVLNNITHPAIIEEMMNAAKAAEVNGKKLFFIDAAVVVGGFLEKHCYKIIVVSAPHSASVARITKRDNIRPEHAEKRLAAQMPSEALEKAASYIVHNNKDIRHLHRQADDVLALLLQSASE